MAPGKTEEWGRWRDALNGAVIGPNDEHFGEARQPWMLTVKQRPAVVVVPANVEDVVKTMRLAAQEGRQVAVQSTGHGALDALEGAVLLRTVGMRGVKIDPARRIARVGPGVRARDLQRASAPYDLSALLGTASTVGTTGYTMGGGVGLLSRRHGLAAHRVRSAELITADGQQIHVDSDSHPDLWWALRGGGTPPAIVMELELELASTPEIFAGQLIWPVEAAADLFAAYRSWTSTVPEEMTSILGVRQMPPFPKIPEPLRGRRVVALTLCFLGGELEARSLLNPLAEVALPMADTLDVRAPDNLDIAGVPAAPSSVSTRTELLTDVPEEALKELTRLGPNPLPLTTIDVRHLGGALARPAAAPAATDRIRGEFLLEVLGIVTSEEDRRTLAEEQDRVHSSVAKAATGRTLRNFAMELDRAPERFFDPQTLVRLSEVARLYDPDGIVHNPLGIRDITAG